MTSAAVSHVTMLSPLQASVALEIASGRSVTEAAAQAGVHRSTVYEWMHSEPAFNDAVEESRLEYIESLRNQLRSMSAKALARIEGLLDDPAAPPSVVLRAALAVLGRPRFPEQGWNLPEPVDTPAKENYVHDLALVEADYKALCHSEKLARAERPAAETDTIRRNPTQTPTSPRISCTDRPPQVPRNAPCPCGSGKKYKRCCGVSAAPVLNGVAAPRTLR